ncbi:MAG: alanine racemase, partial [Burkholderiales bacterium]|nr:alanine racemase [Burkholderiales bacterium]
MPRPIRATISAAALAHNLTLARGRAEGAKVWAVLKANAYGHGVERAAAALAAADGFAVLDFEEAARLRVAGVKKPILMLEGFFKPGDLPLLHKYALTPVIHNPEQVEMLGRVAFEGGLDVYLKVNSGMNRLGFGAESLRPAYAALRLHRQVRNVTLMTHFADADGASGVKAQLDWFNELTRPLEGQEQSQRRSLANSAALLRFPEARGDWVRPGIMLYGCSPFAEQTAEQIGLKPAMTLSSEIISTQHLHAGERIGYGFSYQAVGEMTIGIVACGYADGYPRHAGARRYRLAGARQRPARPHRWSRLDGHDRRRHFRYSRGVHRHAGDALGRGAVGRRSRGRRRDAQLRAPHQADRARAGRDGLMARAKTAYVCSECGATALQWFGSCPSCGTAGTLSETISERSGSGSRPRAAGATVVLAEVQPRDLERIGYGFSYQAVGEMTIGIVACGYADGYPRHAG